MHGVRRARETREVRTARRERERAMLSTYLALTDDILSRKKNKDWSRDAFDLTTQLLSTHPSVTNPEFYTVWNYRRHILTNGIFPRSSPEEIKELLNDDLAMTAKVLKVHPKVYWIWNHRRWCLEHIPDSPDYANNQAWRRSAWERELFIVEKMLDADSRNFLAWDYRRYVLASMPVRRSEKAEIAYTTKKIEANFSNFSAWHQRTKVLSSLWASGEVDRTLSLHKEFELVQNAMFTLPEDQSAWLYHRWLIGSGDNKAILEREINLIQTLLDEQPDSKWCMESLVTYKRLLLDNHLPTGSQEKTTAINQCRTLLGQLEEIDPMRRQRYWEMGAQLKV
ncbi:rab-protein geranylgeranyltransferase [Russula earlei]|uniref:Rab-protein geranylgeranyltransferase n=1 Tax=Russula earlei TaxID=71964 RepID=A0ACC0U361_9AGAM|nr:rab-protein geranylgeranyltransferase [Russula earlei]